ncbi:uncharacterized protein LOC118344890 [Juglans regia]|uniref:Uncharacterized protein LOC118344890 n=1 Tax=Juglans regia TaxID=51240 RepID=A0A6P9EEM0_JUGRE|nr:uncharacterized protein LOC118344890 [Juglans regia]
MLGSTLISRDEDTESPLCFSRESRGGAFFSNLRGGRVVETLWKGGQRMEEMEDLEVLCVNLCLTEEEKVGIELGSESEDAVREKGDRTLIRKVYGKGDREGGAGIDIGQNLENKLPCNFSGGFGIASNFRGA